MKTELLSDVNAGWGCGAQRCYNIRFHVFPESRVFGFFPNGAYFEVGEVVKRAVEMVGDGSVVGQSDGAVMF